jgi:hypothetical protein
MLRKATGRDEAHQRRQVEGGGNVNTEPCHLVFCDDVPRITHTPRLTQWLHSGGGGGGGPAQVQLCASRK